MSGQGIKQKHLRTIFKQRKVKRHKRRMSEMSPIQGQNALSLLHVQPSIQILNRIMKKFAANQPYSIQVNNPDSLSLKYTKLKQLLQNSQIQTKANVHHNTNVNKHQYYQEVLHNNSGQSLFSSIEMSKDLSLYLNIIEKPLNLLFSIDQFVFEFSKKRYQRKAGGDFFQQLKERKKCSMFYGNITRKQIFNIWSLVFTNKGYRYKNLFSLLETRLDVVLYRSGFAQTLAEARQYIVHKKIHVNQKSINIPSYLLNPGDIISLTPETANVLYKKLINIVKIPIDGVSRNSTQMLYKNQGLHPLEKKQEMSKNFDTTIWKFFSNRHHNFYAPIGVSFDKGETKTFGENTMSFPNPRIGDHIDTYASNARSRVFDKSIFWGNGHGNKNFQSQLLCKKLLGWICTRIKSRSFWNIKRENSYFHTMNIEKNNLFSNKYTTPFITMYKWKSRFRKKIVSSPNSINKKFNKLDVQGIYKKHRNIYANGGCLQKAPVFWNRNSIFLKDAKFLKKSLFIKQQQSSRIQNNKHLKMSIFKRNNLALFRKSFFVFFKYLENFQKFTSILYCSMKKYLLKNTPYVKKGGSRSRQSMYKKNLSFRLWRPVHLEIDYNLLNIVYLYSPQRINFPFCIDLEAIYRSLR